MTRTATAAAGFRFLRSGGVRAGNRHKLTDKQRRFVSAYVSTLDPRAAALAAGYSQRHAKTIGERFLGQRRFIEEIARHGLATDDSAAPHLDEPITRRWITGELTELYRTVRACLPAPGQDGKAPSGTSLQSAVKMLELLLKHLEGQTPPSGAERAESEPDLSRLDRDELRQLEALLARTVPKAGSTDPRGA